MAVFIIEKSLLGKGWTWTAEVPQSNSVPRTTCGKSFFFSIFHPDFRGVLFLQLWNMFRLACFLCLLFKLLQSTKHSHRRQWALGMEALVRWASQEVRPVHFGLQIPRPRIAQWWLYLLQLS